MGYFGYNYSLTYSLFYSENIYWVPTLLITGNRVVKKTELLPAGGNKKESKYINIILDKENKPE